MEALGSMKPSLRNTDIEEENNNSLYIELISFL